MWMGGTPPLGYQPDGRSLSIVDDHAEIIRSIFRTYLDLGSVRLLQDRLELDGIVKPVRTARTGHLYGGGPFSRGELYAILNNPIYIGRSVTRTPATRACTLRSSNRGSRHS